MCRVEQLSDSTVDWVDALEGLQCIEVGTMELLGEHQCIDVLGEVLGYVLDTIAFLLHFILQFAAKNMAIQDLLNLIFCAILCKDQWQRQQGLRSQSWLDRGTTRPGNS